MMTDERQRFEDAWARVEAGTAVAQVLEDDQSIPRGVAEDLVSAEAILGARSDIPVPDLGAAWERTARTIASSPRRPMRARRRRWSPRPVALGAVAAVLMTGVALLASPRAPDRPPAMTAPSIRGPEIDPSVAPTSAEATLSALVQALRRGQQDQALDLARELMDQRARALAAGLDVSALDRLIAKVLAPLLEGASPEFLRSLGGLLGTLLHPDAAPTPGPDDVTEPGGVDPGEQEDGDHSAPAPEPTEDTDIPPSPGVPSPSVSVPPVPDLESLPSPSGLPSASA